MERIELAKFAFGVGAPLLILGVVDQTVNRLFFKVYGSRALTSDSLQLANAVIKIVLGTVVLGTAVYLPSYLTSLGLSRTLLHVAWSTNMVYLCCIPWYWLYVMKEVESRSKAGAPDRITPGSFYKNRQDFELAKRHQEMACKAMKWPITSLIYREPSSLGSDYRTLEVWSELAKAIKTDYDCFYNSENPQKYASISDQFNEWINQNKASLKTVKTLDLHDVDFTNLGLRLEQFPQLESLNLQSSKGAANFLSSTPPLLRQLKTINLSSTGLTTFPASLISKCLTLEELDISSNELTTLPEANRLPMTLRVLVVSKNRLIRAIPDSLLRMSIGCRIEVAGIFSYEIFRVFYRRILDIRGHTLFQRGVNLQGSMNDSVRMINGDLRRLNEELIAIEAILAPSYEEAEENFEQTLLFWLTAYQKNFSKFFKNQPDRLPEASGNQTYSPAFYNKLLYHEERGKLSLFLERLKDSKDYTDGGTSQIQLIRRVYRMLELAAVDLRFCEILFPLLHDACSTCHDRPALVFNRVDMQMELFTAKEKDEKALAKLCIGLKRVGLLEECAKKRITQLRLPDPLETILFYETQLREPLELPVFTEKMIFENYAGVSPEMLQEDAKQVVAKTESHDDIRTILLQQEVWHDRMKQIHQVAFKDLESKFGLQMEELSKNTIMGDGQKDIAMKAVVTARENASQLFVMHRTTEWIANNLKCSS